MAMIQSTIHSLPLIAFLIHGGSSPWIATWGNPSTTDFFSIHIHRLGVSCGGHLYPRLQKLRAARFFTAGYSPSALIGAVQWPFRPWYRASERREFGQCQSPPLFRRFL